MMVEKSYIVTGRGPLYNNLYISDDGWVVEARFVREEGIVRFCNQGGGVEYKTSIDDFMKRFKSYQMPSNLSPIRMTGDWMDAGEWYPAWSNGQRWNGWHCPYFELDAALEMAERSGGTLTYNKPRDRFEAETGHDDPEFDYFLPVIVMTVEGQKKAYPIGSQNWCWEEFKDEEPNEGEGL